MRARWRALLARLLVPLLVLGQLPVWAAPPAAAAPPATAVPVAAATPVAATAVAVAMPTPAAAPAGTPAGAAPVRNGLELPALVCDVLKPADDFHVVDILGDLLDKDVDGLAMLLFVTNKLACGEAEADQVLLAQDTLAQQIASDAPKWSGFAAKLPKLVPALHRQYPATVATFAFPTVSLTDGAVGSQGYVPVSVHWLQVGTTVVPRVDIALRVYTSATSFVPTGTFTQGLHGLAPASGWLGGRSVPLGLSGATYWQLGIRPSTTDPFAPYAWGLRFNITIDSADGAFINQKLQTSARACVFFDGTQVAVATEPTPGRAAFWVDRPPAKDFYFSLDWYGNVRQVPFTATGLAPGEHELCVDNGLPGVAGEILAVVWVS